MMRTAVVLFAALCLATLTVLAERHGYLIVQIGSAALVVATSAAWRVGALGSTSARSFNQSRTGTAGPRPTRWRSDKVPQQAVHRTILVVDVENFASPHRANYHQLAVRRGLYWALKQAFRVAGIPWELCTHEDRGDGVFVLAPPEIAKDSFVTRFPTALVAALREHNATHPAQESIRLRLAVHAGEVNYDEHGVTAAAVNLTFRLLDAPLLKTALAESSGTVALIASDWFYDEVVRHIPTGESVSYRQVVVAVKETTTVGWIARPDDSYPPDPTAIIGITADPTTAAARQPILKPD